MVIRKNLKKKYALISVFDKKNLKYLCSNLNKHNYNFISTGSTGNKIRDSMELKSQFPLIIYLVLYFVYDFFV